MSSRRVGRAHQAPAKVRGLVGEVLLVGRVSSIPCYTARVTREALYEELCRLLDEAGVEVRVEPFQRPSDRSGGLCRLKGHHLVLLDALASPAQRARALLEVVERIGLDALGLNGAALSPDLLRQLSRRGRMPWPHPREAPGLARCEPPSPWGKTTGRGK